MIKPLIALTAGEPAGIGLDLLLQLMPSLPKNARVLYVGDVDLLVQRAQLLNTDLEISPEADPLITHKALIKGQPSSELYCHHIQCPFPITPGVAQKRTCPYLMETLSIATDLCKLGQTQALVTGPVHKGIINEAGFVFSGHTEWLAQRTKAKQVVMLLANPELRVALSTTHIPLHNVSNHLSFQHLEKTIRVIHTDMQRLFQMPKPRIAVLGLNPHAGENGHIGKEEIHTITPCLTHLKSQGFDLTGPLSADTAFLPQARTRYDVVLAHYHDQGLPVVKTLDFDRTINITLGLPIFRTSVDHGTAFELVGKKMASAHSFLCAIEAAANFAHHHQHSTSLPQHDDRKHKNGSASADELTQS